MGLASAGPSSFPEPPTYAHGLPVGGRNGELSQRGSEHSGPVGIGCRPARITSSEDVTMPVDRTKKSLNYRRGRSGRPLERDKARVYRDETHCRKCGKRVDKMLPYRDPITRKVNIWSKSYGHEGELDANGRPYGGHLEHLHCNTSAGARYGNHKRGNAKRPSGQLRTSPDLF